MFRTIFYLFFCLLFTSQAQPWLPEAVTPLSAVGDAAIDDSESWNRKFTDLLDQLPPPRTHFIQTTPDQVLRRHWNADRYEALLREQLSDDWYAALVSADPTNRFAIQTRFPTADALTEFIRRRQPLVEVWVYKKNGRSEARRISASELAELHQQSRLPPTFVTVTYPSAELKKVVESRLVFGFQAAADSLAVQRSYRRHRQLRIQAREILGARDAQGLPSAIAQWGALNRAVRANGFPIREMPPPTAVAQDLFVAFEFKVDANNHFLRAIRVYRESQITPRIAGDDRGRSVALLLLQTPKGAQTAKAFYSPSLHGELEPIPNPIPARDAVELRVTNPEVQEARRWNVLEFGEPEVLRRTALAKVGLLQAYLDKERKELALEQSRFALFAEPVFAGLNIGGGVSGVGVPIGEAARLFYNGVISPRFLDKVPTVREMRELFLLLAAKQTDPELKTQPADYLSPDEIRRLRERMRHLTDQQLQAFLRALDDADLKTMRRMAHFQNLDAKYRLFANILTGAAKVSGESESGLLRDILNNPYFALNGDISLKTILAVALGEKVMTPFSGVSLEELADGDGPAKAWVQFFDVTVDLRAILNTTGRLFHQSLADKELRRPFPHAPRMSDLAAYEVRIFGYPLLIYYKRGLLKEDYQAYMNDYAYGLIGTRIVEHFPTRQSMEREIRAGRMFPLGFVRVPGGTGRFERSHLMVFAHRLPTGRYAGRTTIVLFGLKAFAEHSELMQRELHRFQQYEEALRRGAVIEQLVDAEDRGQLDSELFEPKIALGPDAVSRQFDSLLSGLLELRRYWQRRAWGLPLGRADMNRVASILERFARRQLWVADRDALVEVDPAHSNFVYRRYVHGRWRLIRMTRITGFNEIDRGLAQAESAAKIAGRRRAALSGQTGGMVLIHEALETDTGYEAGPLVQTPDHPVLSGGTASGENALDWIFDRIERLPVTDRARLKMNHFSGTKIDLDWNDDGVKETVFLTIEFPFDQAVRRDRRNSWSGRMETRIYRRGVLRETITDSEWTVIQYDDAMRETASRTYFNRGSRSQPQQGFLLSQTRTMSRWFRPENTAEPAPYLPRIAKLKIDHVTGNITRETYGLFEQPIQVADDRFITRNRYNPHGLLESAVIRDNGTSDADFDRLLIDKLLQPIPGADRFELKVRIPPAELNALRDLDDYRYRLPLEKRDRIKDRVQTFILDTAAFGRISSESYLDPFDGSQWFTVSTRHRYDPDFHFGRIPLASETYDSASGTELSRVRTMEYNRVTRRLTGIETDYTGKTSTNIWDYRWENPIVIDTPLRRTTNRFNRTETTLEGATVSQFSEEPVIRFSGSFDPTARQWDIRRTFWYQRGLTHRSEQLFLSTFGKRIQSRVGDSLESRPVYNLQGKEQTNRVWLLDAASGDRIQQLQSESDYRWNHGERNARIQTFVNGQPHAAFRRVTDAEGRTIRDGIRQSDEWNLATELVYDGATERLTLSRTRQNNEVRATRTYLPIEPATNGATILPVRVTPHWGLVSTQSFLLEEPFARPQSTVYENGDYVRVREWFQGTAIPRVSERFDRRGRLKERRFTTPAAGTDQGTTYDRVDRYAVDPWGTAALADQQAYLPGTGVTRFTQSAGTRTYYAPHLPHPIPWFSIDPQGQRGIPVQIGGQLRSHVVEIYRAEIMTNAQATAELLLDSVDLRTLFYHRLTRKHLDPAGHVRQAWQGRIRTLGQQEYSDQTLFQSMAQVAWEKRIEYEYQTGSWVEQTDPGTGLRERAFTPTLHGPINDRGSPDQVTQGTLTLLKPDPAEQTASISPFRLYQRHSPRWLERNPFQPDRTNVWTAWTVTTYAPHGNRLFVAEEIYDAQGNLSVIQARKQTGDGRPAVKTTYFIAPPPSADLQRINPKIASEPNGLMAPGSPDFSGCDYVYFFIADRSSANWELVITDGTGRRIKVRSPAHESAPGVIHARPVDAREIRWLPNPITPRQANAVGLAHPLDPTLETVLVSVHDLNREGLNIENLHRFEIAFTSAPDNAPAVSSLYRLARNQPFIPDRSERNYRYESVSHSHGLRTFTRTLQRKRTERERYARRDIDSRVLWNDRPVAQTGQQAAHSAYPPIVAMDFSDPDTPRPLYAISSRDGRFLEHYRHRLEGHSQIYTVVHGFELPKLEVYRADVLPDELSPGYSAYGYDYHVHVDYARGARGWKHALAVLENRIEANTFKAGGERLLAGWLDPARWIPFPSRYDYAELHSAGHQARVIQQLPTLAEATLPLHPVPWPATSGAPPQQLAIDRQALANRLMDLHVNRFPPPGTGLIPTAPETEAERFVDTVQEADLILLANALDEPGLAAELLQFYWEKSQGGQKPLHASYDARSGTAMTADIMFARPRHSRPSAEAQLAIAEAAFTLGFQLNDTQWLTLGQNLLLLVLDRFRPVYTEGAPRGITRFEVRPRVELYDLTFWPEAKQYPLAANARAYLLLTRLEPRLSEFQFEADETGFHRVPAAKQELTAWFRHYVLPRVEQSGVVPGGLFEIQDINGGSSALGAEQWTAARDWLYFLEAAAEMGIEPDRLRDWLINLARVHGVQLNGRWGLDWSIALLREEAISPELVAQFRHLAQRLNLSRAEQVARETLLAFKESGGYPAAVTPAPAQSPLFTGQDFTVYPQTNRIAWPVQYHALRWLVPSDEPAAATTPPATPPVAPLWREQRTDLTVFILITAFFYVSILISALFWWRFRAFRNRTNGDTSGGSSVPTQQVPQAVMQRAEERWAKRVLGMQTPAGADHTRFSNATVEPNFLMQLRAIYKLVLEWRRQENQWDENDPLLAEDESDEWLNGLDEFVSLVGIYMRWVIKAGAKDGFRKSNVLKENEDSNHIWARLVMYFAEYYWGLLALLKSYHEVVSYQDKANLYGQISQLLETMGVRRRPAGFDARHLFNYPVNPAAFDLLILQQPGIPLEKVLLEASRKLKIPYSHTLGWVEKYKAFKARENPHPIHPYLIEFAKVLPHFLLMGLGALVWFNQETGDSPIVPYLGSLAVDLAFSPYSWLWAGPLLGSLVLAVLAHVSRVYRFEGSMLFREKPGLFLDRTLTSLFVTRHDVLPRVKPGRRWSPRYYQWPGWALRALGYLALAVTLFRVETPSFATFFVVKGLLAMLALAECAAILLPLATGWLSRFFQDWVSQHPDTGRFMKWTNRLNLTATLPASPLWLSIKYHAQPSVPSGDRWATVQTIGFYFLLAAAFFFIGGYLCQQIFSLWFTDTYLNAFNGKLFFGGLLFWNTMYLLRYGLFVLVTGIASALATFPFRAGVGFLAVLYCLFLLLGRIQEIDAGIPPAAAFPLTGLALILMMFEPAILGWTRRWRRQRSPDPPSLDSFKQNPEAALGIVYMSGDDLSCRKLTPPLLMERWRLLRDRLDSEGLRTLFELTGQPDDSTLEQWFEELYAAEQQAQVTLWNPIQMPEPGQPPSLRPELGLNLAVRDADHRRRLLAAWHVRRWLVTMMSTAGHSQDTAINLVDIALRLEREGLAPHCVFYLIQNKYDNRDTNRPVQMDYDQGELAQRNQLARLLTELAPGARAYNLQNWTPFGFKAGGLTGMDLVHEETLNLQTMLLLDRNANVHDLDALMDDLTLALTRPEVVIVIPGRGTTNTLTPVGQGSQLVEEGHRSFLKGLMTCLGGAGSEAVGTGWGNFLAVYYGRTQRAMLDTQTPKMPLTSRMVRGSSFAVRTEGLIGFTPHAVGISEDTWAVSQAAHNAAALGLRVRFHLSQAFWHKIRETWSHSEWLASFPRWSGGYLQMMHDPIMQRINDFGPLSVFAKEIRANSGRNFLIAPFALFNILFMPLAIMLDITPFIQILIVLWNFGFVMNQVLTLHGLNAYLEGCGFYKVPALLGACLTAAWSLTHPPWQPYAPALTVLGTLYGGFLVGVHRWLYHRLRDLLLFGPQLVLHALGQLLRQSMEFIVSGASPADAKGVNLAFRAWVGPREDRPLDSYPHFINLKTVVWWVGLLSVILNLIALANLDMLNVLLLLPSLLFSVSALVGPFVLTPKPGRALGNRVLLPKLAGWTGALLFYTVVSLLIAQGGWWSRIGYVLFLAVLTRVAYQACKYVGYRFRLKHHRNQLAHELAAAGLHSEEIEPLGQQILDQAAADPISIQDLLARNKISREHQSRIRAQLDHRIRPLLMKPIQELQTAGWTRNRYTVEFNRSSAVGLIVLIWFFIVPMPGLFVFTAGDYRLSMPLNPILTFLLWTIAVVLIGTWLGKGFQWLDRRGFGRCGLKPRLEQAYHTLQSLTQLPGVLPPSDSAGLFALLSDIQTYLDQRSYAYARRTLERVEQRLESLQRRASTWDE